MKRAIRAWLDDALREWRYVDDQPPPRGTRGVPVSATLLYQFGRRLIVRGRLRGRGAAVGHGLIAHGTERTPGAPTRYMLCGPEVENRGGHLELGAGAYFAHQDMVPVRICVGPGARVRIGERVAMNYGVTISATGTIDIGDDVMIGPYAEVTDGGQGAPIRIEAGAWIGARVRVLGGAIIERRAVVGAGVVVRGHVPARSLILGDPPQINAPRARQAADQDLGANR